MTNSTMKVKALSDWADCWTEGQVFDLHVNPKGKAYIFCNDQENGPEHIICDCNTVDLTPADIAAGKSDQFIFI